MSRHLVDSELAAFLDALPVFELSDEVLPEVRANMAAFSPPLESYVRDDVEISEKAIAGLNDAPDVRALVYRPRQSAEDRLPVLLHVHGGGYVLGNADMNGASNVRTVAELGCVVVSVDYRLAPETRAPGQVEDCYAVLKWLNESADELRIDTSRIAVGGESAGGGIAAALAQMVRDKGEYSLCFQMLIYPMLDDRTCTAKGGNPHAGDFIWKRSDNEFGWTSLLGFAPGQASISPYASAARTEDLSKLPPTYISTGALDLFVDENIEYAKRLLAAGVSTEFHIYPAAFHGYEMVPEARVSIASELERRIALARAFEVESA